MSGKNFIVPLRPSSGLGPYLCKDGEIEYCEGFATAYTSQYGNKHDNTTAGMSEPVTEKDFEIKLPPAPEIYFRLEKSVLPGWHIHPDVFPSAVAETTSKTADGWRKEAKEVLASFIVEGERNNLFLRPFFAICAWRLTDGSIILPTVPILMIPNSEAPLLVGNSTDATEQMEISVKWAVCKLQYKLTVSTLLAGWRDEVAALEILVSDPLPLYDPAEPLKDVRHCETTNYSHSNNPSTGICVETRLTSDTFTRGWAARENNEWSELGSLLSLTKFRQISRIPVERLSNTEGFVDVEFNCGALRDCRGKEAYVPQYAHLSGVKAACKSEIAGRITLCDLTLTSPGFLPLSKSMAATTSLSAYPRWIFHPDPDAREYNYMDSEGISLTLPLERHPVLFGSYYARPLHKEPIPGDAIPLAGTGVKTKRLAGHIWRSERDMQLLFPDSLLMNAYSGRVRAVCRAFRTSGLVATTTPTAYMFTDGGIYLLRETDTGVFKDAGLIAWHQIGDIESLRMMQKGVRFIDNEGIEMLLEGTSLKTLASSVDAMAGTILIVGKGREGTFETKPIKLGDAEAWKHISRISLRGSFSTGGLYIEVKGSRDLMTWHRIGIAQGRASIIMASPAVRFLKIKATGYLKEGETVEGIGIDQGSW